jgi:hypothetical protein
MSNRAQRGSSFARYGKRPMRCAGRIVNDNEPCEDTMTIVNNFEPIKPVGSIEALAEYRELAGYYDELAAQAERWGRYHASLDYARTAEELRRRCEVYEATRA